MSSPSSHIPDREWHSPARVRVRTLKYDAQMSYRQIDKATTSFAPPGLNEQISRRIPKSTAWDFIHKPYRRLGTAEYPETRGRKTKLSNEEISHILQILENSGIEGKSYTYEMLKDAINIDVSVKTLKRYLHHLDWFRCKACTKQWVNPLKAKERLKGAEYLLSQKPEEEDWMDVRSTDECHFGWGPQGTGWIFRKPGTRYCSDCILHQEKKPPKEEKDLKRVHCFGGVGYNFKSELFFYDSGNSNGKMTQKCYYNQILMGPVTDWIREVERGKAIPFIMEENNDSGHGTYGGKDICTKWKKQQNPDYFNYYFNIAGSPDLAPIENCWKGPKSWLKTIPHWSDESVVDNVVEGWEHHLPQETINRWMLSMPKRLWDVIDLGGQFTGY